jgi:aminopeptidase N
MHGALPITMAVSGILKSASTTAWHGWDAYQHLNREFYGDFGLFDVTLDFPSNYVVEATGVLQNREEALPEDLRKKLDIKNFAGKEWEEAPSIIIPYEKGKRKQWRLPGQQCP